MIMSLFGSGNNNHFMFYGPYSRLHGRVCDAYQRMFKEYKNSRIMELTGVVMTLIFIFVFMNLRNPKHVDLKMPMLLFGSFGFFFMALPIIILLAIASSKHKKVMTGSYQLASVNLIDAYISRHGRNNGRRYYIVVCNEGGARERIIVPRKNYDIACRYIGRSVGLVKLSKGRGMYDDYDYCPGIFEA